MIVDPFRFIWAVRLVHYGFGEWESSDGSSGPFHGTVEDVGLPQQAELVQSSRKRSLLVKQALLVFFWICEFNSIR